jgi:hypothetical protein
MSEIKGLNTTSPSKTHTNKPEMASTMESKAYPVIPASAAPSTTPTLTPSPEVNALDHDAEKQPAAPPGIPGAPFPEGGLKGWAAVAGAWLAGT